MSVMSEIHAEVQLALSAPAREAVRQAVGEVTTRARVAEQCPDTDATLKALREVSWAAIRAAEIIRTVERETREAALFNLTGKAA